ncbi:PhzF family phenazine biosynthesis isomerase [Spirillospora sp. NPDC047279]|uniref:PhzF family phenazine biosynthesis protein n=1 Tax=Spirillospora sp. NPDC047279 TaxID=3155478 RepID=UPI0033E8573E
MRMLVVDAFTDHPFAGNPAGVCLLDRPADPAWMQRVAAEMKHSETAFVRPIKAPDADFELRWFTPLVEVALCGHATLASAHALFETGVAPAGRPIRFQTLRSGVLTVTRADDGGLLMDFPACPPAEIEPPDDLGDALGTTPFWVGRNSQNDLLVQVADEEAVRKLAPDIDVLARVDARGVIVTAVADEGREYQFVSRFFGGAVLLGDGEDPVTGSAHCALGPYWGERFGRTELVGFQASARGGLVGVTLRDGRVELAGRAVTVLDGEFRA